MLCLLLIWKHKYFILNKQTKNFYQGHLTPQKYSDVSQAQTYSQPTRICLFVILLFDYNNRNKFCRHKLLLFVQPDSEFFVNGPEQKMEADRQSSLLDN